MKILLINSYFTRGKVNYGGANKMLLWLGNSLHNKGFDVTFCSMHDIERSDRILPEVPSIQLGIPIYNNYFKRNFCLLYSYHKALKSLFSKTHYDVVINFDGLVFFILLWLRHKFNYRMLISERADPYHNHSFITKLKRHLYKKVDLVAFQTTSARNYFNKTIVNQSVVIPNPIDIPQKSWSIEKTEKTIVSIGRLHIWQKRQDVLLKAFLNINQRHPEYMLKVYGSGPDCNKLKIMAKELKIDNSVQFCGATSEVYETLAQNEIFAITSDFEGIPNSLMEAMAFGCPVVSTKCSPGGAELLIQDGENGLLVDCGDVATLAGQINKLIEDEDLKLKIAANARKSMFHFNAEDIIDKWIVALNHLNNYDVDK